MRDPMIKFSCSIEELKSALQKVGVKNPEIEKDEDVASAVSFLLATEGIDAIEPVESDCITPCKVTEERAIIVVFHETSDDHGYVEAVKKLQKMIFGEKDK